MERRDFGCPMYHKVQYEENVRISLIHITVREASNLVPPLGILSLAAVLRENGFEVQVVDDDPFVSDIMSEVASFKPDLIGIGFYTPAYSRARRIALGLRSRYPDSIICAGGVHSTALPDRTLRELGLDFCVVGEGERTLLEVCERIREGSDYSNVPGLFLLRNGLGTYTEARPLMENLDSLPLPARDLVDYRKYLMLPGVFRGRPMRGTTTIMTVRGCPFKCTYCGSHIITKGTVRFRSVESVAREVEALINDFGVKGVFINDESFTLRRERAIEIVGLLRKKGIPWAVQTRVDLIDEDLVEIFRKSGCVEINFGVESGSDRMLKILRKGTTVDQAVRAFRWCKTAGVRTTANFILGHPLETMEDIEASLQLARSLAASYTLFHIAIPYPGTELYIQALAEGWLNDTGDFDDEWMHRSGSSGMLKTVLPSEALASLRASCQNRFFARNYLSLANLSWLGYYGFQAALHPKAVVSAFKVMAGSKRLDSFLEVFAAELHNSAAN